MNWACRDCNTICSVGAAFCPNCQSENVATDHKEVEEIMASISKANGPTNAALIRDPSAYGNSWRAQSESAGLENQVDPQFAGQQAEGGTVAVETVDYNAWTVPQLKNELDTRRAAYEAAGRTEDAEYVGYASGDKKDLLVELLEADDAEPEEDGV